MDLATKINSIYIKVLLQWDSAKFGDVVHTNNTNPTSMQLRLQYCNDLEELGASVFEWMKMQLNGSMLRILKEMYDLMLEDPWKIGEGQLGERDVLCSRSDRVRRLKKSHIQRCILGGITDFISRVPTVIVGRHLSSSIQCNQQFALPF